MVTTMAVLVSSVVAVSMTLLLAKLLCLDRLRNAYTTIPYRTKNVITGIKKNVKKVLIANPIMTPSQILPSKANSLVQTPSVSLV